MLFVFNSRIESNLKILSERWCSILVAKPTHYIRSMSTVYSFIEHYSDSMNTVQRKYDVICGQAEYNYLLGSPSFSFSLSIETYSMFSIQMVF